MVFLQTLFPYNSTNFYFLPGVIVADKCPILVGKDDARRLAVEDPELKIPAALTALAERPAMSLILKKLPETEGCVVGEYQLW